MLQLDAPERITHNDRRAGFRLPSNFLSVDRPFKGEFFGEGGLAGRPFRMGSATAMRDCELLQIDNKAMTLALHREHAFSDLFVAYLLGRNIRYEEDLVDQLFHSSEKRLLGFCCCLLTSARKACPRRNPQDQSGDPR